MKTKKYGSGGDPLFLRLNQPDREAWEAAKAAHERHMGRPLSHSLFATLLVQQKQTAGAARPR